VKKYTIKTN